MTNPVNCFTRRRVKVVLCNLDLASKIANVLMVVVERRRTSRKSWRKAKIYKKKNNFG